MIVAVVPVGMVQVALHQIVGMAIMQHGLMAAIGSVSMIRLVRVAMVIRRALVLIGLTRRESVLVHVVSVYVMQVAIVQIVRMAIVLYRGVTASGPVDMSVRILFHASFCHSLFLH
jgi:hypothetical protein